MIKYKSTDHCYWNNIILLFSDFQLPRLRPEVSIKQCLKKESTGTYERTYGHNRFSIVREINCVLLYSLDYMNLREDLRSRSYYFVCVFTKTLLGRLAVCSKEIKGADCLVGRYDEWFCRVLKSFIWIPIYMYNYRLAIVKHAMILPTSIRPT